MGMMGKKICFVASSGGHLQELSDCLRGLEESNRVFLITEKSEFQKRYQFEKTYYVDKIDRKEKHFFLHFCRLIRISFSVLRKENPDVVISTGALIAVPVLYIARLMGKKIIFLETIARVDALSLTGKLVYPIANLFLVQWEILADKYKKAVWVSRIVRKEGKV